MRGCLRPGTDRFRPPEQLKFLADHKDDRRARYSFQAADEIFTVGAMLYELLTDPRPTERRARSPVNDLVITPPSARKVNPRVPEALSDLVESILSRDPARRPVDMEALRRELADLLEDSGADYTVPLHPPSEQRQAGPTEGEAPATPEPARKPRPRKLGALAAGAAAAVLAAVVALWSAPQEVPAPPTATHPSARPVPPGAASASLKTVSPDMSAPAPIVPGDAGSSPAAVQEEVSTVKTQRTEAPREARTGRARKAFKSTVSVGLPLCAVLTAGCPSIQIRPEPFECPAGSERNMREVLRWKANERFRVVMDDRHKRDAVLWFQAGADVVGVVPKLGPSDDRQRQVAPEGTRFLGGKVYLIPENTPGDPPGRVIVKYDRVEVPGKDSLPVCFVVDTDAREMKDTAGRAYNEASGRPVTRWP